MFWIPSSMIFSFWVIEIDGCWNSVLVYRHDLDVLLFCEVGDLMPNLWDVG